MKRVTCVFATVAILMWTSILARAVPLGTLPKDQEWSIEVTNQSHASDIYVTVYYLGHSLDVIDAEMTVTGGAVMQRTFPKPGPRVKRVIIDVDLVPGALAVLRFPDRSGGGINLDSDRRIVFNVV